ncbi:MAG: hypothetical protein WA962_00555 [Ornithinimicrobium sp.]
MTTPAASVMFLALAAALHAGFQLTVTTVVYPALAAVQPSQWQGAHAAHGRAITPMVGLTYGALLLACVWSAWANPLTMGVWICIVGAALSMSATAFVAAPTHGRLSAAPDPHLLCRLIRSDQVRAVGALVALAGGALAAFS